MVFNICWEIFPIFCKSFALDEEKIILRYDYSKDVLTVANIDKDLIQNLVNAINNLYKGVIAVVIDGEVVVSAF